MKILNILTVARMTRMAHLLARMARRFTTLNGYASSEVNVVAETSQDDSRISARVTSDLQQITLYLDVLHKLSDSMSNAIINGLKAGTNVVQTVQVTSVAALQLVNRSNCEVDSAVQQSVTGALNVLSGEIRLP